ncbi:MAG: hypothetical protein CMF39_02270 [Legionellaceae bacterium]|nr:hypothetical protein [Legionellaceae bacterium]
MSEIMIYKTKDGHIELNVSLAEETVWLSLNQMALLFGRDKSVVSRHLSNIFKNNELARTSVVAKFATTAADGKTYQVDFYNLDAIISLGYRINSSQATKFRQWATRVLKEHLIRGYTTHEKRLAERGIKELEQSIELLQKTLTRNELVDDIGTATIQLIMSYAKTWRLLLAYDEGELNLPTKSRKKSSALSYKAAIGAINALKTDLLDKKQASDLFGNEKEHGFQGILGNIEQTFDGEHLYKTAEERAAHLLYFIIKDHPFSDGNKRIGCLMFLLYLKLQNMSIKINDNGLVALALLIAESDPQHKDLMTRLIVNLLLD